MSNRIITISREYGAGGRSVARQLSERLGIPWYDKDFIKKTAAASGYTEEEIREEGEAVDLKTRWLTNLISPMSYESSTDAIYRAQKEVILDTARKESCILIGRCANIILKEEDIPHLSVFLYADKDHRLERASQLHESGEMDLEKFIERRDSRRAAYYKIYTGHSFGDYHDYQLSLDTGAIGYEGCVDIITGISVSYKSIGQFS